MNKKQKAAFIRKTLESLFPHPKPSLTFSDPYTCLIAVLLSAQCTDERVNKVTPLLFAKAKTPEQMITLSIPEIESIVKPCGIYKTKARAIWNLSKMLIEKHKSKVPANFSALENLPGVGHKTASVVMSQAFGKLAFPVDTHIFRCAHRWGLSKGNTVEKVEEDLKKLFPSKTWRDVHLQMISFARKYCPARAHKKEKCPICSVLANKTLDH